MVIRMTKMHNKMCTKRYTKIPVSSFHIMAATTFKTSLPSDTGRTLVKTPDCDPHQHQFENCKGYCSTACYNTYDIVKLKVLNVQQINKMHV